ncbi:NACHT, LRR and PYD domains-containing protein 5 [Coemansia sp. RSA 1933]|nr:NACHT, LRR and PYD domains-containing protein 5 [Coemansia sp. RSA 1933]
MLESSSPTNVDVDNEAAVRRTIQKISMGDFAHLPPTKSTSPVEKNGHLAMGLLELDYTEVGISDRTHFTLGDVLLLQPLLQALNVSNNAIGPKSTARLIKAVSSGCPSLRVLNLSGNLLRSEGAQIIAHYLAAEGRNLESLDISSNEIPPTGAAALASSLSALSGCRLKALNVDMNQFEVNGCEALAHALAENKYLETLVISRNNIFDNGCGLLFDGLKSNNTLLRLDVSGNFLTHLSARSFASYMDSRNRASDREFQGSFMRMGIRTLNISANALRDEGITALCAGLQNNAHLMHLLADNVEVADPGMESIRQLLETTSTSRTSLLTLSLLQNRHATRVGFEALGEGCQKNSLILRVSVDPGFDEWSAAWDKGMVAFINNTMRAVDRYRVPLLMVARGHLLLYKYSKQRVASAGPSSIQRLPEEVRWIILSALDTYGVLTAKQRRMALKIASTMSGGYPSKKALLAAILGADYRFVAETMKTLNSL